MNIVLIKLVIYKVFSQNIIYFSIIQINNGTARRISRNMSATAAIPEKRTVGGRNDALVTKGLPINTVL